MVITYQCQKFQWLLQAESHTEAVCEERPFSEAETNMSTDPWHENCGLLSFLYISRSKAGFTNLNREYFVITSCFVPTSSGSFHFALFFLSF